MEMNGEVGKKMPQLQGDGFDLSSAQGSGGGPVVPGQKFELSISILELAAPHEAKCCVALRLLPEQGLFSALMSASSTFLLFERLGEGKLLKSSSSIPPLRGSSLHVSVERLPVSPRATLIFTNTPLPVLPPFRTGSHSVNIHGCLDEG